MHRPALNRRYLGTAKLLVVLLVAIVLPAHAAGPVVHTYFDPDPGEDLALHATTTDGKLPAAIETPSGVVQAPDPLRSQRQNEQTYGGGSTPASVDATYRIDRNTSRPEVVSYDDPFIPAITPFKRLFAYDVVEESLELGVADKALVKLPIGGNVRSGDDQFYADMNVDLVADTPVRIPSVGPGTRVLSAHTVPPTTFQLQRDGAENWFIRSGETKRVRMVLQLAIAREAFGSPFSRDASFVSLSRFVPHMPASIKSAAERVLEKVGISRAMTPAAAVTALVAHFRSFAPSNDRPISSGAALYEELALSKKGVCRHRAYAFIITAQALGIPTRMIRNEAHAWVEVFDALGWHRVDLGGAAERLDTERDPSQPMHAPPADPFKWPDGAESAGELVERTISGAGGPSNAGATSGADGGAQLDGGSSSGSTPVANIGPGVADGGTTPADERPASKLGVNVKSGQVRRGEPLAVVGRVEADGEGCRGVRVDFALRSDSGKLIPIQSLSAGEDGKYDGAIVVPPNLEVGEYELVVSTPGDARCGAGVGE
ncbi:MAG: transglutaminase domain-containing protein [Myxococcales bacterium]|nr:transglutaminase domain-containing protein [Myxococcales bacterium]